jgi:aminodeoxyfutalosine deaminase
MKRLAAQFIITNSGPPLKRGVITTEDDGTIMNVEDTSGDLKEKHSIEFYNGIIIPGFVNCHCHLELSHMKGKISIGTGLDRFIEEIRNTRNDDKDIVNSSILSADLKMNKEGIVLCADVCNTSETFLIKKKSGIRYINLLEVFGIDPEKAVRRIDEINQVALTANDMDLSYSLVPHSAYSMSVSLFRLLRNYSLENKITSMHFMETKGEEIFLNNHSGPLMSYYLRSGLLPSRLETVKSHDDAVLNEITKSGNLILVHNTFVDEKIIKTVKERTNLFWCLCPNSNIYIENTVPPLNLLIKEDCEIVIGTDSLASNSELSVLEELKTLQMHFPDISIEDLVLWATMNGARALGEEEKYGKIETGKKPGLLLLQNVDLQNMKLLPDSFVTRLI